MEHRANVQSKDEGRAWSASSGGDGGLLLAKPRTACRMLACGNTRLYELLAAGELESFLDGRSRKITVDLIDRFIARRLTMPEPPALLNGRGPRRSRRPRKREIEPPEAAA